MSFSLPWINYLLDEKKMIFDIKCRYKPEEEFIEPEEKNFSIERFNQKLHTGSIGSVETVIIETDGVMRFTISKNRDMKIKHVYTSRQLKSDEEEQYYMAARKHGYRVTEFSQTDV